MMQRKKTTANIRDWGFIYEQLGNSCCSLTPVDKKSSSPDYLLYLGLFGVVIGIQQKSGQPINTDLIVEEAKKFIPITTSLTHVLLIIGLGVIDISNIEKNCADYKVKKETGTIFFPPGSTLTISSSALKNVELKNKKKKEKIEEIEKKVKNMESEETESIRNKRKANKLTSEKYKLQKLKAGDTAINCIFTVPAGLEIYVLSEIDLKYFFSESVYYLIKGNDITTVSLIPQTRANSFVF